MKDIKAATSGMFVNPAYCAVLAAAATADSSTPPAVNNLMAVACFLRPYSPWILYPLRNLWISCPCPAPSLLYPNPCLSSRLDSAKIWASSDSRVTEQYERWTEKIYTQLLQLAFLLRPCRQPWKLSSASALLYLLCFSLFSLFAMVQRRIESAE